MDEAAAVSNAIRPRLTAGWVGSLSVMVEMTCGASRLVRSTRLTVLATALSTHAEASRPSFCCNAIPRGTAPTSTRPNTLPLLTSTVNTLSEAAADTTSVESSSLI